MKKLSLISLMIVLIVSLILGICVKESPAASPNPEAEDIEDWCHVSPHWTDFKCWVYPIQG